MNTKTPEKQKEKFDVYNPDKAIMPGKTYFIILTTTIILLLSFTIALFAVFAKQSKSNNLGGADVLGGGNYDDNEDDLQNNAGNSPSINQNNQGNSSGYAPGKTNPTRSNYVSKTASGFSKVGNQIASNNVILVDLGTYESIAEKGADDIIYPASMTKVMSLLVACEQVKNLNTKLKVTKDIADYAYKMGGSGFLTTNNINDELTVRDLLYLTSYKSDTIAVIMLANHIAGSEAKFVKLMNQKANALGLKNTNFANCTGLHNENNYSTCREIAAIMAYALDNPLCKQLLTSTEVYKIQTNSNNYTLWEPTWNGKDRFAQKTKLETVTVKGGKTGYIDESGVCLVSYAEGNSNMKRYIQVIVGQPKGSGLTEADSTREVKFVYNTYAK
ncbi:MAG: D-alanyl-D-alanine carboxypeptidase [Ruminococcaceae bacterium]|nr:D-alanyl-D-alanine carboxypeptidase [Oscillospiraceae bacterium]